MIVDRARKWYKGAGSNIIWNFHDSALHASVIILDPEKLYACVKVTKFTKCS